MKKLTRKNIILCITCCFVLGYVSNIAYTKWHPVDEIPILGYHHIVPDDEKEQYFKHNMWVNSLSDFKAQMKLLHDCGYHTISLDELYEWRMHGKKIDDKSIVITFDDGFYSSIEYALPVLDTYGFEGNVFVIGKQIPKQRSHNKAKRPHATIADMKQVPQMKFYAHSYDLHHKDGDFRVNMVDTKGLMEDTKKLNELVSTTYYAYPYGKYNARIIDVLKQNHTKLAFGFNENKKAKITDDPYALPRFNVNAYTKLDVFYQMIK